MPFVAQEVKGFHLVSSGYEALKVSTWVQALARGERGGGGHLHPEEVEVPPRAFRGHRLPSALKLFQATPKVIKKLPGNISGSGG